MACKINSHCHLVRIPNITTPCAPHLMSYAEVLTRALWGARIVAGTRSFSLLRLWKTGVPARTQDNHIVLLSYKPGNSMYYAVLRACRVNLGTSSATQHLKAEQWCQVNYLNQTGARCVPLSQYHDNELPVLFAAGFIAIAHCRRTAGRAVGTEAPNRRSPPWGIRQLGPNCAKPN